MQSSSESYGGLTEDSVGEAYNSSKDGTLVMREVMKTCTHTHTHTHRQVCLCVAIEAVSVCFFTTIPSPVAFFVLTLLQSHLPICLYLTTFFFFFVRIRQRRGGEGAVTPRATGLGIMVTSVTSPTFCSRATLPRPRPPRPCRSWPTSLRSSTHTVE